MDLAKSISEGLARKVLAANVNGEVWDASRPINEDATVNDSTHIINYKNSYDNTGRKVKVILSNNEWLVDFKYTFDGNL